MKSRTWVRLTVIGAVLALAVLTLSTCCTSAPIVAQQHGCCAKGRCASISAAVPFVAVTQAKHRMPVSSLAAGRPNAVSEAAPVALPAVASLGPRLFAPIATVQLRI